MTSQTEEAQKDSPTTGDASDVTHDEVTRRLMEMFGGPLSPEEDKRFRPKVERLLRRERHPELDLEDILLTPNPVTGELYDPYEDAAIARRAGLDITEDPDWQYLCDIFERGRKRRAAFQRRQQDPLRAQKAFAAEVERILRKTAARKKKLLRAYHEAVRGPKSRSKVSRAVSDRDIDCQREIIQEIQAFLKAQQPIRLTPKKHEVVHPSRVSPLLPTSMAGRSTTHDHVVWLPHWEKTLLPLRAMAMGIACGEKGGFDFTLHLDDEAIKYGMGVGEMQFARRMYRRIDDALHTSGSKKGLPACEIMLCIEQGEGERPHVHGIILPERPLKRQERTILRDVLRVAGGPNWKPVGSDKTQAELGTLYEPAGWIAYITKYTETTKSKLGDNIFASSRKITQMGNKWYQEARRTRLLLLPGKAISTTLPK